MALSDTEIANKALDYLLTKQNQWIPTKALLISSGCSSFSVDHAEFRRVMNKLFYCGMVGRSGVGSFSWSIKYKEWNRHCPFLKKDGAPIKEPHYHPPAPKEPAAFDDHSLSSSQPSKYSSPEVSAAAFRALVEKCERMEVDQGKLTGIALELIKRNNELAGLVDDLRTQKQSFVKELKIKKLDGTQKVLKNKILPKVYDRVFQLASMRRNVMLFGPAGCGKTYLAKMIAESLDLPFGSVSCTAGMSEAHLLGRSVPNIVKGKNVFQGASFLKCYEQGGVYLLDELDAADPNLLLCLNTALANGYCNVPNRRAKPTAERHEDFVCIGTANTTGRGANRMYVGRNQLDEATLDRFRIGCVEMDYDANVENSLIPDEGEGKFVPPSKVSADEFLDKLLSKKYGLLSMCRYIRHMIEQGGVRRIMSTRFMEDANVMMKGADWQMKDVLEVYFEGWTNEEKAKVCA